MAFSAVWMKRSNVTPAYVDFTFIQVSSCAGKGDVTMPLTLAVCSLHTEANLASPSGMDMILPCHLR